jgi:hypothetical protein
MSCPTWNSNHSPRLLKAFALVRRHISRLVRNGYEAESAVEELVSEAIPPQWVQNELAPLSLLSPAKRRRNNPDKGQIT